MNKGIALLTYSVGWRGNVSWKVFSTAACEYQSSSYRLRISYLFGFLFLVGTDSTLNHHPEALPSKIIAYTDLMWPKTE